MRLDQYLVLKGYAKSRSQASDLIKRGLVEVDGNVISKQGFEVIEPLIKMLETSRFVSRSGEKLLGAILDFKIDLHGKIAIDIGSSTGGFTDCAIQMGAKFVYAYDVGSNQMDETLRLDSRIELHEETNIKTMPIDALPLSERTRNALIKNNILYVEDLEKKKKGS